MDEKVLLGRGQQMLEIPQAKWKEHFTQPSEHRQERLSFMTEAHQRVRYFVVKELVNQQKPLEPEFISKIFNDVTCPGIWHFGRVGTKTILFSEKPAGCSCLGLSRNRRGDPAQTEFQHGERLYAA